MKKSATCATASAAVTPVRARAMVSAVKAAVMAAAVDAVVIALKALQVKFVHHAKQVDAELKAVQTTGKKVAKKCAMARPAQYAQNGANAQIAQRANVRLGKVDAMAAAKVAMRPATTAKTKAAAKPHRS